MKLFFAAGTGSSRVCFATAVLAAGLAVGCGGGGSAPFVSCVPSVVIDGQWYAAWDMSAEATGDLGAVLAEVSDSGSCGELYERHSSGATVEGAAGWAVPAGSVIRAIDGVPSSAAVAVVTPSTTLVLVADGG